jgi:dipeptidyl aminopeptidase/acylaminoacyl peptidase
VPFSTTDVQVTGESFLVASDGQYPSVADDGTLVYSLRTEVEERSLVWLSREGEVLGAIGQPGPGLVQPALSPDERNVAAVVENRDGRDIWIYDVESGNRRRLTLEVGDENRPAWSIDGKQVFYNTGPDVVVRPADGSGNPVQVGTGGRVAAAPDGRTIVTHERGAANDRDAWLISLEDGTRSRLVESPGDVIGRVSPDGRFYAYASDETGTHQVYLTRFPTGEGKWQVSTDHGTWPRWSGDGKTLFFSSRGAMMAVEVGGSSTPLLGPARVIIESVKLAEADIAWQGGYDVDRTGQRFVMIRGGRRAGASGIGTLVVVQNWTTELGDR